MAVYVESATSHEVRLVHATLAERFVKKAPVRLIGDNAFDSDKLDAELGQRGVELTHHTGARESGGRRMVVLYAATDAGGRWNDSLHGCRTFAGR